MTTLQEKLTIAANRFYMNESVAEHPEVPELSDKEYDALAAQWEKESGKSVKTLVNWELTDRVWRDPIQSLPKEKYMPEDILKSIKADYAGKDYVINYKYDGCAVEAHYSKTGKLDKILGTPDEEFGFIRTEKFWNLFPHQLPDSIAGKISRIFGEVLVDAQPYGQLARNKANGLCNSKNMQDDIETEALVRVYNAEFYNKEDWNLKTLRSVLEKLPVVTRTIDNVKIAVFDIAEQLSDEQVSGEPLVWEEPYNGYKKLQLQVDGYVVYCDEGPYAFKMYYTDHKDVEVKGIEWTYNWTNGSYMPVLNFDTVLINDKKTSKCATGGVPNMLKLKMGVGSIVRVIMSGGTIPKVIKVLKESEGYQYPTCECGTKLSEKNLMGSVLKCSNPLCTRKVDTFKWEIAGLLGIESFEGETLEDIKGRAGKYSLLTYLDEDPYYIIRLLHIDRFKPEARFQDKPIDQVFCELVDSINSGADKETIQTRLMSLLEGSENPLAIDDSVSAVEKYRTDHTDESFDKAVAVMMDNVPQKTSSVYENYIKECTEFLSEGLNLQTAPEMLEGILYKYFNVSALMKRNASSNESAVCKALEFFL